ncbi:MAG: DUF2911 domain-containing protein [Bacteroidetes bacterium]|nr:DUF2911 domain-containing protein [Bacteroidota bacterium]
MKIKSIKVATSAIIIAVSLFVAGSVSAQTEKSDKTKMTAAKKDERPSPPKTTAATVGDLSITINYSQPGVKGRKIFGELVPFGKIWRTGANEATTVEVSRDCKVGGSFLKAGKYALFTIPGADEWTIIFNSVPDQWGAYKYDESKDALRFKVKPQQTKELTERLDFTIASDKTGNGTVTLKWENTSVTWEMR